MKEKIFEFVRKMNIEYVGVAPVFYYDELKQKLIDRKGKYGVSQFEEENIEKRVDPRITFPWAKSIIVCLFPYYTGMTESANISIHAQGTDYHKIVNKKLSRIKDFIEKESNARCECFCDTGSLCDRYLAYLAGLGFIGLNTCLINEKYGSYVFIGYIVTDLELESDTPIKNKCVKCNKCEKACPGNAIDGEFSINAGRCVSYITQLKKLTEEQTKILKSQTMVYGCDECQKVCPYNEKASLTPIKEFYENKEPKLKKEEILNMSNKEFLKKYGDFSFSWRGKATILRNFDK